jgi:hypothetical protein
MSTLVLPTVICALLEKLFVVIKPRGANLTGVLR